MSLTVKELFDGLNGLEKQIDLYNGLNGGSISDKIIELIKIPTYDDGYEDLNQKIIKSYYKTDPNSTLDQITTDLNNNNSNKKDISEFEVAQILNAIYLQIINILGKDQCILKDSASCFGKL